MVWDDELEYLTTFVVEHFGMEVLDAVWIEPSTAQGETISRVIFRQHMRR